MTSSSFAGGVLIVALMSGAIAVGQTRDRAYTLSTIDDHSLYITSSKALDRMTLGFRALAADLYWIRTLQYFGGIQRRHHEQNAPEAEAARAEYSSLYPLLDLTTSLDPRFNIAYRFGAIFLSEPPPGGPGRPDLAITLLEKGLSARPDKWEYMQDIGFVHYWWNHDYHAAAAAFEKASEFPNAPWWLKSLAATTLARGGDRRSSRVMWAAISQTAEVDFMKRDAQRRLAQLDALDAIDVLQPVVDRYVKRVGEPPADWSTLVAAGDLRGVPRDPTGTPFALTREGRVELSNTSTLWPPPAEPGALGRPPS